MRTARRRFYRTCADTADTARELRAYLDLHAGACGAEWREAFPPTPAPKVLHCTTWEIDYYI